MNLGSSMACAVLLVWVASAGASVAPAAVAVAARAQAVPVSSATRLAAAWVLASDDHQQQPFAVVDKRAATLTLYGSHGQPVASSPVLLGRVRGDHSVPGVGERTQAGRLLPGDATTPAGRFVSVPGFNRSGEAVVWLDAELAFAIHRLRPGKTQASRAQRLAAGNPAHSRVSAGCVVVPVVFYETVLHPLLGRQAGVVYVLPEQSEPAADEPAVAQRNVAR